MLFITTETGEINQDNTFFHRTEKLYCVENRTTTTNCSVERQQQSKALQMASPQSWELFAWTFRAFPSRNGITDHQLCADFEHFFYQKEPCSFWNILENPTKETSSWRRNQNPIMQSRLQSGSPGSFILPSDHRAVFILLPKTVLL